MQKQFRNLSFIYVLFFVTNICYSQSGFPAGNNDELYLRILQISGITEDNSSYMLRPVRQAVTDTLPHPWHHINNSNKALQFSKRNFLKARFFEPVWFQSYNTTLPRGTNDGAIWQGKGYNTALSVGAELSAGPLHIRFRPIAGMSQNRSFDLGPHRQESRSVTGIEGRVGLSEFSYPYSRGVDYVQRYGDSVYSWFDLGDSSVELRYAGVRLALSNKQIWTGPGVNKSLQFGYSAPGFRHIYMGTYRPVITKVGSIEFAYIFGESVESNYYTINRVIQSQSINSLLFIYKPWFTDRFSFGAIRTFFHPFPQDITEYRNQTRKLFQTFMKDDISNEDIRGTFPDNQVMSLFFRYIIPEHGLDIYTEYGRNDHNSDLRDMRAQPNHYRAYTLGMLKTFRLPRNRLLAINVEMNQLEVMRTALTRGGRALAGWFTHDKQILGLSNRGQIFGTGYGPGVNMQKIRLDLFHPEGGIALKAARITYDNSRLDNHFKIFDKANKTESEPWEIRNIEIIAGIEATAFFWNSFEVSAILEQSYIMNQYHLKGNDLWNTRFELVLRKRIKGWSR